MAAAFVKPFCDLFLGGSHTSAASRTKCTIEECCLLRAN